MFEGLRKWPCGHPELTPEDGEGRAICIRCGAAVVVRLTKEIFEDWVKRVQDEDDGA